MKIWLGRKSSLALIAALLCMGTLCLAAGVLAYGPENTANLFGFLPGGSTVLRPLGAAPVTDKSGVPMTDASVTTDRQDYSPGQIVHITGAGFMAGENVQMRVVYVPGDKPANRGADVPENVASGHDPWTVTA